MRLPAALVAFLALAAALPAPAVTPAELRDAYALEARRESPAFTTFSTDRGRQFFSATHGKDWSCATCHTGNPAAAGKHASTGKAIAPLAPTANAARFTDASLEPAPRADILAFLEKNAGRRDTSAGGKPLLRISETGWFAKEHRKEIAAGTPKRADVKTIANCGACHRGAESGDYGKAGLQVPGGRAR